MASSKLPPESKLSSILSLLLLLSSSSSPKDADAIPVSATVTSLPGFDGPLPFHLETGYVGVGDLKDYQLFYYFVESEKKPREDPLILWLTGGPGCSSLSAFMFKIGPLYFNKVEYNGSLPTLNLNPNSWTKLSNIIFLDSPIGSGFSYRSGSDDYRMGDVKAAKLVSEFIRKWLIDQPRFLANPLYIGGDSYSGMIVPLVTQELSNDIEAGQTPILNLKGYILGNPVTDAKYDVNSRIPFLHGMGLISDEIYESAKRSCNGDYINPITPQCLKDIEAINELVERINSKHVLEPYCPSAALNGELMGGGRRFLEEEISRDGRIPEFTCRSYSYILCYYWANMDVVRNALHICKGTVKEWVRCNYDIPYTVDVPSTVKYHLSLTSRGYRALVYSGDHDLSIPFLGTQAWIRSLNFSIFSEWRPWSLHGQVAGYTRTYSNNLTFATVKVYWVADLVITVAEFCTSASFIGSYYIADAHRASPFHSRQLDRQEVTQLQNTSLRNALPCFKGGSLLIPYSCFLPSSTSLFSWISLIST